ncbi:MAG: hypothetical protein HKN12_00160, partial [Gemmatimonadetes bacterium]|nr:hypothetical protein [Gemmatimonadota bacterium]
MTRTLPAAAAAILALAPAPAFASNLCPIDDFETGAFDHSSNSAYEEHIVPVPGYNSHCITPERKIVLEPTGGTVHARLNPGQNIDDGVAITVRGTGRCRINYDWGFPADLTFGGKVDRIVMQVSGPAGIHVTCGLQDAGSATGASRVLPSGGGVH